MLEAEGFDRREIRKNLRNLCNLWFPLLCDEEL
jgi:hypothetical protein